MSVLKTAARSEYACVVVMTLIFKSFASCLIEGSGSFSAISSSGTADLICISIRRLKCLIHFVYTVNVYTV